MNQVLVRVKRLRKSPYKKLLSGVTLYQSIDLASTSLVDYSPDHKLDEDAWFKLDRFSVASYAPDILGDAIDTKDYNSASKEDFADISHLLSIQQGDIYFQKVTPAAFIKRKLIQFGEVATLHESDDRLVVKSSADAVYLKASDTLIFRDLSSISSIFKGIDELYKEATDIEVMTFLSSDFMRLAGTYSHASVSTPNRKRIALVSDTLNAMPVEQRTGLIAYIKDYCKDEIKLSTDGRQFEISSDKELKLVLYGIEERFYTTQHSRQKRLANSIQKL